MDRLHFPYYPYEIRSIVFPRIHWAILINEKDDINLTPAGTGKDLQPIQQTAGWHIKDE